MGMGMGMGNMNMMGGGGGGGGGMSSGNSVGSGSSNHRPMAGGVSAVAYEAARADHYRKLEEKQAGKSKIKREGGNNMNMNPMDAMMGSGMGMNNAMSGLGGGGGNMMPTFGLSVNPNQHYEMLKLHHMNLLNEIQETTLMMNLYQQQQLQQQQLQQQQQGVVGGKMGYYGGGGNQMGGLGGGGNQMGGGGNSNFLMGMINQSQGGIMNPSQGMEGGSMGVGGGGNQNMMAAPQDVKNEMQGHDNASVSSASGNGIMEPTSLSNSLSGSASNSVGGTSSNYAKTPQERALWLRKLKEDIAQREREAAELEASLGDDKRRNDGDDFDSSSRSSKRMKKESVMTAI